MKNKIVSNRLCPACAETGHDSKQDHLLVFEDGNAYCSKSQYHKTGQPLFLSKEQVAELESSGKINNLAVTKPSYSEAMTVHDIYALPSASISDRKLSKETLDHFGVRVSYDPANGELEAVYYPYYTADLKSISAYKVRRLPKEFFAVGTLKGVAPFGFNKLDSSYRQKLLITEGEYDAMAAWQMLKDKYPQSNPQVISLTNGANGSSLVPFIKQLREYNEVILSFDKDAPGQKAVSDVAKLIGYDKVKVMR